MVQATLWKASSRLDAKDHLIWGTGRDGEGVTGLAEGVNCDHGGQLVAAGDGDLAVEEVCHAALDCDRVA